MRGAGQGQLSSGSQSLESGDAAGFVARWTASLLSDTCDWRDAGRPPPCHSGPGGPGCKSDGQIMKRPPLGHSDRPELAALNKS